MPPTFSGARGFIDFSRQAAALAGVSAFKVFARLVFARLVHSRGIKEFDQLGFSVRPVRDWQLYQPSKQVRRQQERVSRPEYRAYDEDKLLFAAYCQAHALPTPAPWALLLASGNGDTAEERYGVPVLQSGDATARLFRSLMTMDGFAKPVGGGQGWGAFGFTFSEDRVCTTHGVETSEAFFTRLTTNAFGARGYVLQPRLRPHAELAWGMKGQGIGTIRMVTALRTDGSVHIVYALLFLVPEGAPTDKPRDGGFFAPVDLATGRIGIARGRLPGEQLYRNIERMPPNGERFVGRMVPCWAETLALVERAARAFAMLPALGWDVAVTPEGPVLVETNCLFGTGVNMARTRPGEPSVFDTMFAQLAPPQPPDPPLGVAG